jgi:hypothetical protein
MRRVLRALRAILLKIGKVLGRVNTTLLLLVSFYLILLPISLVRRAFKSKEVKQGWLQRPPRARDHFKKQF